MKKFALCALILLGASSAKADIFRCVFTEPFSNYTYSMAQQKLTIQTPDGMSEIRNVGFQIFGRGRFILGDPGAPIMRMYLTYNGSDGMSDYVYPYRAKIRVGTTYQWGGCESNFLRKRVRTTSDLDGATSVDATRDAQAEARELSEN